MLRYSLEFPLQGGCRLMSANCSPPYLSPVTRGRRYLWSILQMVFGFCTWVFFFKDYDITMQNWGKKIEFRRFWQFAPRKTLFHTCSIYLHEKIAIQCDIFRVKCFRNLRFFIDFSVKNRNFQFFMVQTVKNT